MIDIFYGIIFIILGLIFALLHNTRWYKESVEEHNYAETDDFFRFIRNVVEVILIIWGIFMIIMK